MLEKLGVVALLVGSMLFQFSEPSIPVLWAAIGIIIFVAMSAFLILLAPIIHQNFLQQRKIIEEDERKNRIKALEKELSTVKDNRLESLERENLKKRGQIDDLQTRLIEAQNQYLELRKVADKLELNLEAANDRLLEWENASSIDS